MKSLPRIAPPFRLRAALPLLLRCALPLLLALQVVALARFELDVFSDDAAFFFRYAEHLAAGHGYRWNLGEAPVWGASAPLWPLFLAGGILAGLPVESASLLVSWSFMLLATGALGLTVWRLAGGWAVLGLATLIVVQHHYNTLALMGLETPLTFALVALAFLVRAAGARTVWVGLVAGALMVHKVDLIPFGVLLLLSEWSRGGRAFARAVAWSLGPVVLWYGFATWHFGSPLPNSFRRKLELSEQLAGAVPRTWIGHTMLLEGGAWVVSLLALAGATHVRRFPWVVTLALGAILFPVVGYTLVPPSEPFHWYVGPGIPGLLLLATLGLERLFTTLRLFGRAGDGLQPAAFRMVALAALALGLHQLETPRDRLKWGFNDAYDRMFVTAGRWVDRAFPASATLMTGYGNIAYYSRRHVFDASGLNRAPSSGAGCADIASDRPDVLVFLYRADVVPPEVLHPPSGYRTVRLFREVLDLGAPHYLVGYAREGVPCRDVDERMIRDLLARQRAALTNFAGYVHAELGRIARDGGRALPVWLAGERCGWWTQLAARRFVNHWREFRGLLLRLDPDGSLDVVPLDRHVAGLEATFGAFVQVASAIERAEGAAARSAAARRAQARWEALGEDLRAFLAATDAKLPRGT
ncbi:MAG: hypothetical protein WD226_01795 [Planctomycetota bacterium]